MKVIHSSRFYSIVLGISFLAFFSCSKPLTKQKVAENIEDAKKATTDAKERTLEAIDTRVQLFVDYRETRRKALEDRIENIDDNINDLEKTSSNSENRGAEANIKSAIDNLENEKNDLHRQMDEIRAIEQRDWSSSYENVNRAFRQLEEELQKLSQSLADFK